MRSGTPTPASPGAVAARSVHARRAEVGLVVATAIMLGVLPFVSTIAGRLIALGSGLIALAVLLAADPDYRAGLARMPRAVGVGWALWGGWAAASLAWSADPLYSATELEHEVAFGFVTFGVFFVAGGCLPRLWPWAVALTAGFLVMVGRAAFEAASDAGWQPLAWQGGPAPFTTYLLMLCVLLFGPLAAARGRPRWGATLGTLAVLAFMAVTLNRFVWVACAAGLVAFIWARARLRRSPLGAAGWKLGLLGATLLAAGFLAVSAQRAGIDHVTLEEQIASDERIKVWVFSSERIRERPLLGHGFGQRILEPAFRERFATEQNAALLWHGHNLFVNQALQLGIPGILALCVLFGALAGALLAPARNEAQGLAAAVGFALLVAFLVKNLTDDSFVRQHALLFWALEGALLGYARRASGPAP